MRNPAKALCALIALGAMLALMSLPAEAAFPGANGRIAFSAGESPCNPDSGNGFVQTMNSDGSDVRTLGEGCNPAWTADGATLAFDVSVAEFGDEGFNHVFTAAADGTDRSDLGIFNSVNEAFPAWSPDGRAFAYSCTGICVHSLTGGGGRRPLSQRCNTAPAWSPDGTRIAFARVGFGGETCDGPKGILTMSAAGGDERLVAASDFAAAPNWSPDGEKLVYAAAERVAPNAFGYADLFAVDARGGPPARLTSTPTSYELAPAWSPDGTQIAFARAEQRNIGGSFFIGLPDVYVMSAGGSDVRRLTTDAAAFAPDWQPLPGPRPEDFKNRAHFCKSEREFWGQEAFRARYGGHANSFGKCVSAKP